LDCTSKYLSNNINAWAYTIEIIDIKCLYSYLFSVKNLSPQNGGFMADFGWSQTSEARNFARLKGVRIVFSTARFEDLKWKKVL
jgi:hypothetical protein